MVDVDNGSGMEDRSALVVVGVDRSCIDGIGNIVDNVGNILVEGVANNGVGVLIDIVEILVAGTVV